MKNINEKGQSFSKKVAKLEGMYKLLVVRNNRFSLYVPRIYNRNKKKHFKY